MPADQRAHELRGQPPTAMIGLGADGADLGPTVQTKPLAGHRDELPRRAGCPGNRQARWSWSETAPARSGRRARASRGHRRAPSGIASGAIDPGDPLLRSSAPDRTPRTARQAVWQLSAAVPAGRVGTRRNEIGGVPPVLCRWAARAERGTARRRPDIGALAHAPAQAAHASRTAPRTPDCRIGLPRSSTCRINTTQASRCSTTRLDRFC